MNRETSQPDDARHDLVVSRLCPEDLERWCGELTTDFGESAAALREFVRRFPDWLKNRNESISRLKEIADRINQTKQKATISRIVGSSASIVGGVGMVATTAAFLPLVPVLAPPLVAFTLLTAGTVTSLGSIAAEGFLKKHRLKEVKKILEKDREQTDQLNQLMNRNKDLITKIEQVMTIDVFGEMIDEFIQLINAVFGDNDANWETCANEDFLQRMLRMCPRIASLEPSALIVVRFLITNGYLIKLINYYKSHVNGNPRVREYMSTIVKVMALLAPTICKVAATANTVLAGGVHNSTLSQNMNSTGKSVTLNLRCLTASLGVALDTVNLILGARDLHNRIPSEYATEIQRAVEDLEEELDEFSKINTTLRNCFIPEVTVMTDC